MQNTHLSRAFRNASPAVLACIPLVATACGSAAVPPADTTRAASTLGLVDAYPVVVLPADRMEATRDFYVHRLGLAPVFESTWFVALGCGGDDSVTLALMAHDHPSTFPGTETLDGRGMFVTLQVTDARKALGVLRAAGVELAYPLTDEPWGQRRFSLRDPVGTVVDVVEQIEPASGYWDRHQTR